MLDGNISYLFETITTTMTVYLIFNVFSLVKMSSEKLFCWFVTKKKKKKNLIYKIKDKNPSIKSTRQMRTLIDTTQRKNRNKQSTENIRKKKSYASRT